MSKSLEELSSASALSSFISSHSACIVTFSATWCGPCQASRPALEELAKRSASIPIALIYEHNLQAEGLAAYNVRAFPTHVMFGQGEEMERVVGANMQGIEAMMAKAPVGMPATGGATLGGSGGIQLTPEQARLQRLAALGAAAENTEVKSTEDIVMKDAATAAADESPASKEDGPDAMDTTTTDEAASDTPTVDPTTTCNEQALKTLTEEMGFSLLRAQKGLLYSHKNTVEAAIEWLTAHQDDLDIDAPIDRTICAPATPMSYKCNTCGKVLSSLANLELHANKTGHSDFEESTENAPVLTPEQKAAKIAEIKDLLKKKRAERLAAEQVDEIERERLRRLDGANMRMTKEQHEIEQRKRDAYLRQKEKQAFAKERARIKAELEKDKLERQANKGKLKSKLGVEGYHPDAIQYDVDPTISALPAAGRVEDVVATGSEQKKPKVASATKIGEYIDKVSSYRAGGDGGKCLKVLLAYIGNVVDHPDEAKYRTINMDNKVFKTKVKGLIGAKQLLLAVGFEPSKTNADALELAEEADAALLTETKTKLQAALERYG
ncbi:hypothetical protein MPSEU_000630700 [Mayamaea pseudoterrestris]|nr:hypothetical protein MPSEU_000630700 [Mayamaea pseudoterrestris]